MSQFTKFVRILPLLIVIAGCATPKTMRVSVSDSATKEEAARQMEVAVQDMVDEQKRLTQVYRQLSTQANALCGKDVGPSIGAFIMTKQKGDMGDAFARLYGIKEQPTVVFTLEGGPAEKAGLMPGDVVLSVNGVLMKGKAATEKLADKLSPVDTMIVEVDRSGVSMTLTLQPDRGCRYSVLLSPGQIINAFADGKNIMVTRSMMSFAKDDNELALVISHEMAHNTMKHMDAKKQNAGFGLLADLAVVIATRGQARNTNFAQIGANSYSHEFEAEADYVGLYIMANAGLPIVDAPKFWRRMAASHPASIKTNHSASHPSTAYRMVALEETVKEITEKVSKNEPLVPNMKDGKPAAPTK